MKKLFLLITLLIAAGVSSGNAQYATVSCNNATIDLYPKTKERISAFFHTIQDDKNKQKYYEKIKKLVNIYRGKYMENEKVIWLIDYLDCKNISTIKWSPTHYDILSYVSKMKKKNAIIEEIPEISMSRISDVVYSADKSEYLYVLWNKKITKINPLRWKYGCVEQDCTVIYHNTIKNSIGIFITGEKEWPMAINYWLGFTFDDQLIIKWRVYKWFLEKLVKTNEVLLLSEYNAEPLQYNKNSYLNTWWSIEYIPTNTKNVALLWYMWWNTVFKPQLLIYDVYNLKGKSFSFNYPYYHLNDDLAKFNNEEIKEIMKEKNYEKDYIDNFSLKKYDLQKDSYIEEIINKNEFILSVTTQGYNPNTIINPGTYKKNLIENSHNKTILKITNVDPRKIDFSFRRNVNMWNTQYQVFSYIYNSKAWYFIYSLEDSEGAIIEWIWDVIWEEEDILLDWKKKIKVSELDFQDIVEIEW